MTLFVFDTSAFINGWREHYPPDSFPGVWRAIGEALDDGRIIVPREVARELEAKDDDLRTWVRQHPRAVVEPDEDIQRSAANIELQIRAAGGRPGRNAADPFVIAEALARNLTVVTYEGRNPSGRIEAWGKRMPGFCEKLGVPHCHLAYVFPKLKVKF